MRGDINGASATFGVSRDQWSTTTDGLTSRRILAATLREVSLCAWPCYTSTTAEASGSVLSGRAIRVEPRAGKVLSKSSRDTIQEALDHLAGGRHWQAADTLRGLLANTSAPDLLDDALEKGSLPARTATGMSIDSARRQFAKRQWRLAEEAVRDAIVSQRRLELDVRLMKAGIR